ncbi:MAG: aldo/keto reductase [Planctomycetota bacterium]|nr:MAG: aldo/keto reductase [Planctomycetota bacterium]
MKDKRIDRRNFLKTIGATGLGSVLGSARLKAEPVDSNTCAKPKRAEVPELPKRKLGKTGVEVPVLALGGDFNFVDEQIRLHEALDWGINYWDTAHFYGRGNSERGIGKFLAKDPETRKKLFIATKASGAKNEDEIEERLQMSLERMHTDYIDLYYGVHMLDDPERLTDELRQWAENAKKRKVIRLFGVSTHKNMAECLAAVAKLDWIDAVMTSYNFRLMQDDKMQGAIDACHKAGTGLIAMKVQGHGQTAHWVDPRCDVETEEDKKLVEHFLKRGFTKGQAKIKVVLQDERFSSACVAMDDVTIMASNVAAVLDKTKLSQADFELFKEYAQETCSGYCAGCASICESAVADAPRISEVMRYLMYYNSYGRKVEAKELFAQIPSHVRNKLPRLDYSRAEDRCPQHLPISKLMAEAVDKLA